MELFLQLSDGQVVGLTFAGWWLLWSAILSPLFTVSVSRSSEPDRSSDVAVGLICGIFAGVGIALLSMLMQEAGGLPHLLLAAASFLFVVALSVSAWHLSAWLDRRRGG